MINTLKPEKLITLNMELNNKQITALIDTGATMSLIRKSFIETDVNIKKSKNCSITGFNNGKIKTLGTVDITPTLLNMKMTFKFHVVEDKNIEYPMIIGIDFLQKFNMKLYANKRKITISCQRNAFTDIYLDEKNQVRHIVHENIPIMCARKNNHKQLHN